MDPFDLKYLPLALMGVGDMTKSFNKIHSQKQYIRTKEDFFHLEIL